MQLNVAHSVCIVSVLLFPNLIQNNPAVKKSVQPHKGHCEKRCEIQGGCQEMAVMVG